VKSLLKQFIFSSKMQQQQQKNRNFFLEKIYINKFPFLWENNVCKVAFRDTVFYSSLLSTFATRYEHLSFLRRASR